MTTADHVATQRQTVLVIGDESVGKSALIASLTGHTAYASNFRGSTVSVHRYHGVNGDFVDTPGILFQSDSETTRLALSALDQPQDRVLVVVKATNLDQDLTHMLPLVVGKRGAVVVTFWDKVKLGEHAFEALEKLSAESGVPFVPLDARQLTQVQSTMVFQALDTEARFKRPVLVARRVENRTEVGTSRQPLAGTMAGPCSAACSTCDRGTSGERICR